MESVIGNEFVSLNETGKIMKKRLSFLFMILIFITALSACSGSQNDLHQFETDDETRLLRFCIKDYGNLDFRIYPDAEPVVAARFIELAESGYYTGMSFNTFIDDYLAMAGPDSDAKDSGKEKTEIRDSETPSLYPFYGALCLSFDENMNCDMNRFYVITVTADQIENLNELVEFKGYTFNDYMKFGYNTEMGSDETNLFKEYGGAPWLYGHTCVIGQCYDGMELLEEIMDDYRNGDGTDSYLIERIETDGQ